MHFLLKGLVTLLAGVALGLFATWASVIRDTNIGGIADGPWHASLLTGSVGSGPYLRASVAVHGLLALDRSEAIYYTATRDSAGERLSGDCTYRIAGRDPPARWWSITAYGADDFLIPNPQGRYSASANTIARRGDGSFVIAVGKEDGGANWIPVGDGPFSLTLRLYNPNPASDPAHLALPEIRKAACT
jgi:hypothetical protein